MLLRKILHINSIKVFYKNIIKEIFSMIKKKKKKKVIILKTIATLSAIALAGFGGYTAYKYSAAENDLRKQISELNTEITSNKAYVYTALSDIQKGDVLVEGLNVIESEHYLSLSADAFITYDDLGKIAMVDIAQGSPILTGVVTDNDVNADTREVEIKTVELMSNLSDDDYVDIRIVFPSGADFVVLPKLKVKDLNFEENVFFTRLSESQIITLTSATVDAFLVSGTRLYMTKYIEPALQEASIPNYPVSPIALNLIADNPNVVDIAVETLSVQTRNELMSSVNGLPEEVYDALTSGYGLEDYAQSSGNLSGFGDGFKLETETDNTGMENTDMDAEIYTYGGEY